FASYVPWEPLPLERSSLDQALRLLAWAYSLPLCLMGFVKNRVAAWGEQISDPSTETRRSQPCFGRESADLPLSRLRRDRRSGSRAQLLNFDAFRRRNAGARKAGRRCCARVRSRAQILLASWRPGGGGLRVSSTKR